MLSMLARRFLSVMTWCVDAIGWGKISKKLKHKSNIHHCILSPTNSYNSKCNIFPTIQNLVTISIYCGRGAGAGEAGDVTTWPQVGAEIGSGHPAHFRSSRGRDASGHASATLPPRTSNAGIDNENKCYIGCSFSNEWNFQENKLMPWYYF